MIATLSEKLQADRWRHWVHQHDGPLYVIRDGPNPPDFLLDSKDPGGPQTWLEVSDIYVNEDQARFVNSRSVSKFEFEGTVDATARRFLVQLDGKLGKSSYRSVFEERGRGFLLLTCEDVGFSEIDLFHVHDGVKSFVPKDDQGFFDAAYFEYRLGGGIGCPYTCELIWKAQGW